MHTFCGTPAFIAPEVAARNGHGTAADWWSLGVLIYQLLTLATPFEGPTSKATIENVIHGRRAHAAEDVPVVLTGDLNAKDCDELAGIARALVRLTSAPTHPLLWSVMDAPTPATMNRMAGVMKAAAKAAEEM